MGRADIIITRDINYPFSGAPRALSARLGLKAETLHSKQEQSKTSSFFQTLMRIFIH